MKSNKGCDKWHKTCFDIGLSHRKQKTLMKIWFLNKVIMFQETLEYCDAINLCYGKQEIQKLQSHVLDAHKGQFVKWLLKYVSCCEVMYPQSNPRILVNF
jgi:hypothetical protein